MNASLSSHIQVAARRKSLRSAAQLVAACALTTVAVSADAQPATPAPSQVVLWGVQRGCDTDAAAERSVVSRLESFGGGPVRRLTLPADSEHRSCLGEQCAKLLAEACPALGGQLVGAEVDELIAADSGAPALVTRVRLWRHDLSNQRTYYQYALCHRGVCGDLSVADKVAEMASQIIERPAFDGETRPAESIRADRLPLCSSQPSASSSSGSADRQRTVERLYQQIYVAVVIDPALASQQKEIRDLFARALPPLVPTGFRDQPLHVELRAPEAGGQDPAWAQRVLQAAVAARGVADRKAVPPRLLVVQVSRRADGEGLTLDARWLPTEATEAGDYDFPAGGYRTEPPLTLGLLDVNALAATLRNERSAQLARVRGAVERRTTGGQSDLCRPFAAPRCANPALALSYSADAAGSSSSPPAFKIAQGALWGLFAASAATAVTLFAINGTDASTVPGSQYDVQRSLVRPAWTAAGFSLATLALAVPATILVRRAERQGPTAGRSGKTSGQARALRCPQ